MQKILLTAVVCLLCFFSKAQKFEQYCEMTAIQKILSRKVTIDLDEGQERKLFSFKDNQVKDDLGKVKSFNSVVDALNYMGKLGWRLVNAFPAIESGQNIYHYVFKKEFDKAEINEIEQQTRK